MFRAYSSILFSSRHRHTASILEYLHITWLAQNKAFRFKTHLITYPPLHVHSGLCSGTFCFITMPTCRMLIHFQLAATAPLGPRSGMGMATSWGTTPSSVRNRPLSLRWDRIKGFTSEHIRGLIRIYPVCCVKDERAWDLFHDTIFLDPVTTGHFLQFHLMWRNHRSRSLHFREWWVAFRSYLGQMFNKYHHQMNNWEWDNPRAFRDQVDLSNLQTTSSGMV